MTKITLGNEKEKDTFNQLATHPLQSWEWGEFRQKQGIKIIRLISESNQGKKAAFLISFHRLPLLKQTIGYLPKSLLPDKETLIKIKEIGKQEKAIFIKLEPNVEKTQNTSQELKNLGLTEGKSLFTKYTSVIDLTKPEEEIFNSLKSKTRYNIRLAEKHGVKIREDSSEKAFEKYLDLLFETTNRQGFYAHNREYHRQQWQILSKAGISHLLTANFKNQTLSSFLLFAFNKTLYYPYGASTREHKDLMAPTLLMWEAIKFGKKLGCDQFDLWGDTQPNPPPNHPYYGFHRFKESFSPRLVEFVGSWDLVINPWFYSVYNLVDKIRWKLLRLKAKL